MQTRAGRVSIDRAKELFSYDSVTGVITRKVTCGGQLTGTVVGTKRKDGYLSCRVNGQEILHHRLAWLLFYGEEPSCEIDHINADRTDSRISNLRAVDRTTNNQNRRGPHKNNLLGVLGVSVTASGKFKARIRVEKKLIDLGSFKTIDLASAAYMKARREMHKGNTL